MGIGLKIVMGQAVAHDKGQGPFLQKVWAGIDGGIHFAAAVGGSQDTGSVGALKVFFQVFHNCLLWLMLFTGNSIIRTIQK